MNLTELWTALANIWQVIPVESFQKLVVSMPRRVVAVIIPTLLGKDNRFRRVRRNQTVMRMCGHWMQEGTTDRRGRSHPSQCTT
ncbi:hypothetical protein TNCV_3740011 [Trichonephila clavipes]|nr:hypothetical protein TNCV_3740011 [Trichonephila clavipes]